MVAIISDGTYPPECPYLLNCSCTHLSAAEPNGLGRLEKAASWQWPDVSKFEQYLTTYLDDKRVSDDDRKKVLVYWKSTESSVSGPALLDRVIGAASLVEPRIGEVVNQINDPSSKPVAIQALSWLTTDTPGWLQDSVRLAIGRSLHNDVSTTKGWKR